MYYFDVKAKKATPVATDLKQPNGILGTPDGKTLYIGTLGAETPTGENWATPQGVRNIAATIYAVPMLAEGP